MSYDKEYDVLLKLIIIGDSNTGKTSLTKLFCNNVFSTKRESTVGIDFASKTLTIGKHKVVLQIWDTAGQERYKSVSQSYYRGSNGAFIVFDVTNIESLKNINKWINRIKDNETMIKDVLVIGNKVDLDYDEGLVDEITESICKDNGLTFIYTSAKDNTNVKMAFDNIIHNMYKNYIENKYVNDEEGVIDLYDTSNKKKSHCC